MARKLVVPVDFGIENLHCAFHGNVHLKLQGGRVMRANSLILSYHSPVFVYQFLQLHQSVLTMDEYLAESVERFIEALYSGRIELERHTLRDVNKMCHLYKVGWLSARCLSYYKGLTNSVAQDNDFKTLMYLMEEANYGLKELKSVMFLDVVTQKFCGMENTVERFLRLNMKDYTLLKASQLDILIQITLKNPSTLLHILKKNIEKQGMLFDKTSRYLLQKIDLYKCISQDKITFDELFGMLKKIKTMPSCDALIINNLQKDALEKFKNSKSSFRSQIKPQNAAPKKSSVTETPDCLHQNFGRLTLRAANHDTKQDPASHSTKIPNVFSSFIQFERFNKFSFLNAAAESPLVSNVYMLLEGVLLCPGQMNAKVVNRIKAIRSKRGWNRISQQFLLSWAVFTPELEVFKACGIDLISPSESIQRIGQLVGQGNRITSETSCKAFDLFNIQQTFAFFHPSGPCSRPGKCGFLLKVMPAAKSTSDQPNKFKVNLCLKQSKYPSGLHIHPESVSAEKIHLSIMGVDDKMRIQHFVTLLTWNDVGVRMIGLDVCDKWMYRPRPGNYLIRPTYTLKLVAYVTV